MSDLSNKLNNHQILTTRSSRSCCLNQSEIKETVIVIKESLKSCYQKQRSIDFRFSGFFSHFRLIFTQSTPMQEFILYF